MDKEEIIQIIAKGLESCEYNYSPEDIYYKIVNIYLKETSNSRYNDE